MLSCLPHTTLYQCVETVGIFGKEAQAFFLELAWVSHLGRDRGTPISPLIPLPTATDHCGHAEGQCSRSTGHSSLPPPPQQL